MTRLDRHLIMHRIRRRLRSWLELAVIAAFGVALTIHLIETQIDLVMWRWLAVP